MSLLRAKVTIPRDTNLPEDVSCNTFHFSTTEAAPFTTTRTEVTYGLTAFYQAWDQYLSSLNAPPADVTYYNLGEPEPRAPVGTSTIPLTVASAGDSIPEECAVCLSFAAAAVSGEIRARRRGRVYLGPLTQAVTTPFEGRIRVNASFMAAIITGATALLGNSVAATLWNWVVYSPTSASEGGSQDDWYSPVDHGWVDNAFDTQRRRGPRPTGRLTF